MGILRKIADVLSGFFRMFYKLVIVEIIGKNIVGFIALLIAALMLVGTIDCDYTKSIVENMATKKNICFVCIRLIFGFVLLIADIYEPESMKSLVINLFFTYLTIAVSVLLTYYIGRKKKMFVYNKSMVSLYDMLEKRIVNSFVYVAFNIWLLWEISLGYSNLRLASNSGYRSFILLIFIVVLSVSWSCRVMLAYFSSRMAGCYIENVFIRLLKSYDFSRKGIIRKMTDKGILVEYWTDSLDVIAKLNEHEKGSMRKFFEAPEVDQRLANVTGLQKIKRRRIRKLISRTGYTVEDFNKLVSESNRIAVLS